MLHGYTQNGQLFHAKTRVLEKHLQKTLSSVSLSYPTGPLQLNPSDVPGFDGNPNSSPDDLEAYGWWRRSDGSDPPEYVGIEQGLDVVAQVLKSDGPFDGVIGFSQGACLAGMVASLLEGDVRKKAFEAAQSRSPLAVPYPASFAALNHPPLKFCVPYSGFAAPGARYEGFYNDPYIHTRSCQFIGSLDSVVEEKRTQTLIDAFGGSDKVQVVTHPGGHFVPNSKQYLDTVAAFIKTSLQGQESTKEDERVEDMDVPF